MNAQDNKFTNIPKKSNFDNEIVSKFLNMLNPAISKNTYILATNPILTETKIKQTQEQIAEHYKDNANLAKEQAQRIVACSNQLIAKLFKERNVDEIVQICARLELDTVQSGLALKKLLLVNENKSIPQDLNNVDISQFQNDPTLVENLYNNVRLQVQNYLVEQNDINITNLYGELNNNNNTLKFTSAAAGGAGGHAYVLYKDQTNKKLQIITSIPFQEGEKDEYWYQNLSTLATKNGLTLEVIEKNKQNFNQGCIFCACYTESLLRSGEKVNDLPAQMPKEVERNLIENTYHSLRPYYTNDQAEEINYAAKGVVWLYDNNTNPDKQNFEKAEQFKKLGNLFIKPIINPLPNKEAEQKAHLLKQLNDGAIELYRKANSDIELPWNDHWKLTCKEDGAYLVSNDKKQSDKIDTIEFFDNAPKEYQGAIGKIHNRLLELDKKPIINQPKPDDVSTEPAKLRLKTLLNWELKNPNIVDKEQYHMYNGKQLGDNFTISTSNGCLIFHSLDEDQAVLDDIKLLLGKEVRFYQYSKDEIVKDFTTNARLSKEDSAKLRDMLGQEKDSPIIERKPIINPKIQEAEGLLKQEQDKITQTLQAIYKEEIKDINKNPNQQTYKQELGNLIQNKTLKQLQDGKINDNLKTRFNQAKQKTVYKETLAKKVNDQAIALFKANKNTEVKLQWANGIQYVLRACAAGAYLVDLKDQDKKLDQNNEQNDRFGTFNMGDIDSTLKNYQDAVQMIDNELKLDKCQLYTLLTKNCLLLKSCSL